MNFCAGVLLPYPKLSYCYFGLPEDQTKNVNIKYVIKQNKQIDKSYTYYNLFYNGTWQKPEKNVYYMHNDNICMAQASRYK